MRRAVNTCPVRARICGTWVIVIATRGRADTGSAGTVVSVRAFVSIVADSGVGCCRTTRYRITAVVCARIAVVAKGWSALAVAVRARVIASASVPVVALRGVYGVFAACGRHALVVGAWIIVVAHHRKTGACDVGANVQEGAGVPIVAEQGLCPGDMSAIAVGTNVIGAFVSVVCAWGRVDREIATGCGVADVVRARVVVFTGDGCALAGAAGAQIGFCTGGSVVAGNAIVSGGMGADVVVAYIHRTGVSIISAGE